MDSTLLSEIVFSVATTILLSYTVVTLIRWKIYSFLFGALTYYGGVCIATVPRLATQFDGNELQYSSWIFFVGTITLVLSVELLEVIFPSRKDANQIWREKLESASPNHANISLLLIVISIILQLSFRKDISQGWSAARSSSGLFNVFATNLFLLACPGIASCLINKKFIKLFFLIISCVFAFLVVGSRAAVLGAFAYGIWIVYIRASSLKYRLRLIATLGACGLLAHVALRFLRGIGLVKLYQALNTGQVYDLLFNSNVSFDFSGGEASISKYLVFATNHASYTDYGFMTSVRRLLFFFIPRLDWLPIKPLDVTYTLWSKGFSAGLLDESESYQMLIDSFISGKFGSLHPILFGELFLSGAWISLLYSLILYSFLIVAIDRFLLIMSPLKSLLLCGPVLIGFMMIARGNSVIGFGYFIYLYVIVSTFSFILSQCLQLFNLHPHTYKPNLH